MINRNPEGILEFEEATHTYRLDGVVVPSVTQILREAGLCGGPYPPGAAERGALVHLACECDDLGPGIESFALDDGMSGYLEAWRKFRRDTGFSYSAEQIEVRRCDRINQYAGTIDRIVITGKHATVLDIKSGGYEPWHAIQLAAYAVLVGPLAGRMAAYLASDGSYSVRLFPLGDQYGDWNVFRSALNLYNWKRRMNL